MSKDSKPKRQSKGYLEQMEDVRQRLLQIGARAYMAGDTNAADACTTARGILKPPSGSQGAS